MTRKFRLLKKIELSESVEVWSIFEVKDNKVIVDWCWSMSAEWFIKHWYIEEVKAPTHFGNGMCDINDSSHDAGYWVYFIDNPTYIKYLSMIAVIYKIRQRHSENDGKFGLYDIFYNEDHRDFNFNKKWQVTNPIFPMFSSNRKAQECIDHFGDELDILLSRYKMQKNNQ